MATIAANFYSTFENQPSIFEIIAQQNLNATLHPALEKVAQFAASCNSKYFNWLLKYYDETYLLLNSALQCYYLRKHGGSFAEHFYGLKRQRLDGYELTNVQKYLSWAYLVILPYLYKKFKERVQEYQLMDADQLLNNDPNRKYKKALIYIHSGIEISWGSWILLNYLNYMSNKSQSQLPALQILNLHLIYDDNIDHSNFWTSLFLNKLSFSEAMNGLLKNSVQSLLEISAFLVQFLQVWNSERMNFNITQLPPVDPPAIHTKANIYKRKCPICLLQWKMPTVLPVSG